MEQTNPPVPLNPLPEPSEPADPKRTFFGLLRNIGGILLNWFVVPIGIVLVLHNFVFQAFHVVGNSMAPYLHESDYLIISKVSATVARAKSRQSSGYIPKRGEVVVFRYPNDTNLVFVKRVVGLPGERVVVQGGKMTIYNPSHPQGFSPDQGYQPSDSLTLGEVDLTVPTGQVFVVGDNRAPNGSFDSREWGPLPTNLIVGQAVLRLLPLDQFKLISNPVKD